MNANLLFVGAIVLATIPAPAQAQNDRYGIHTYDLSRYLAAKSQDLGTGFVRIQIDWDTIQPSGPNDWNDSTLISWLNRARARHLKR
jgi:hypothetical protein